MNKTLVRTLATLYKKELLKPSIGLRQRYASTFKAAVIAEYGKPLAIQERKQVKLKSNQVRVQVSYCSVNSVDNHKFKHGGGELPFIPGYELSGEVLEVGNDVRGDKVTVGEKVVGLSLENFGGLAEQCVVSFLSFTHLQFYLIRGNLQLEVDDVFRIPAEVSTKDAAVIAYGHTMALYTFSKLSPVKENDKVVITAGPAGLGMAAVDVAANIYKAQV